MSIIRLGPDEPRPLAYPLRRIAVLRALYLGDLLCVVPALRALRQAQPTAQITLIGLPWAAAFVRRYPRYVDDLLVLDNADRLPPLDSDAALALVDAAGSHRFELVLQMHDDGGLGNSVAQRLGGLCAGFHPPQTPSPGPRHLPWIAAENEVRRWLRLLDHLGADANQVRLEFPIELADRIEATSLLAAHRVPARYVCIHAGARLPSRRWTVQRYADTARALLARGWGVVLTGSGEEAETVAAVRMAVGEERNAVANLCGHTSLGGLAAVIANASALICNDTGVSHLAAAVGTPSVVVACGSDIRRWSPLDRRRHQVIAHAVACSPCRYARCPYDHACATSIPSSRVIDAALQALSLERRHAA